MREKKESRILLFKIEGHIEVTVNLEDYMEDDNGNERTIAEAKEVANKEIIVEIAEDSLNNVGIGGDSKFIGEVTPISGKKIITTLSIVDDID